MSDVLPTNVMARFRRPIADRPTTVAIVGDPHIPRESVDSLKLYQPGTFLERAVEDVNDRSVDATLFVGDLTMDGFHEEFDRFDRIVADLDDPWMAIPGNHDVPKTYDDHESPSVSNFQRTYAPDDYPFTASYGDLDILALDSASSDDVLDTHDGVVGERQVAWLDDELARATNPVVTLHHALPPMIEQFDEYRDAVDPELGQPPVLRNPQPLVDTLQKHDVPLVLTGHLHIPSIAELGATREVNAPATSTFPPAYLLLEVGPSGTVVRYVPLGDVTELRTTLVRRRDLKPKADALVSMASARLARFPLVDETGPQN